MSQQIDESDLSISYTKSELIQRILDSFKPTTNLSHSSLNETTASCQSLNCSHEIYIHFKDKNELGFQPQIDDLLEKLESNKTCSCDRLKIILNNQILNQQLSYKQKQSLLRIVLRRQQIFNQYFS